jgi:hypothetical protein
MTIEHVKLHTFDILMCLDELVDQAGYENEGSIEKQLLMESIEENKEESDRKVIDALYDQNRMISYSQLR